MKKAKIFFSTFFAFIFLSAFSYARADLYLPTCAVSATTTAPNQPVLFTPAKPSSLSSSFHYKWVGEASTTSTGPISMAFIVPGKYTISLEVIASNGEQYGALCPDVTVAQNATSSFANIYGAFYPYPFISSTTRSQIPIEIEPVTIKKDCFNPVQNLSFGYYDDVKVPSTGIIYKLQNYLKENGYLKVNPTGYFGPMTLASVKAFQLDNDVEPTGFVGPITRGVIKRLSCGA